MSIRRGKTVDSVGQDRTVSFHTLHRSLFVFYMFMFSACINICRSVNWKHGFQQEWAKEKRSSDSFFSVVPTKLAIIIFWNIPDSCPGRIRTKKLLEEYQGTWFKKALEGSEVIDEQIFICCLVPLWFPGVYRLHYQSTSAFIAPWCSNLRLCLPKSNKGQNNTYFRGIQY